MFNQEPVHLMPKKTSKTQKGGGSAFHDQFYAVHMDNRNLTLITEQYINESPMFNPLKKNTVIPTIYNGIVPTGAYLLNNLPTTPDYAKYTTKNVTKSNMRCSCHN
jgi:hypothetical protein